MAGTPRLTPEQWAVARRRWEGSPVDGFAWLVREIVTAFGVTVARQVVARHAAERAWAKGGEPSAPLAPDQTSEGETGGAGIGARRSDNGAAHAIGEHRSSAAVITEVEPVDLAPGEKPVGYVGNGRPSKYRPEYDVLIVAYFDKEPWTEHKVEQPNGLVKLQRMATDPPMLAGFARSIGVTRDTVNAWATNVGGDGKPRYPSFSAAYAHARELNESMLARGAALGLYEGRFLAFMLKNLYGWQDQPARAVAVAPISAEELERLYGSRMKAAQDRQAVIRAERAHLLCDVRG